MRGLLAWDRLRLLESREFALDDVRELLPSWGLTLAEEMLVWAFLCR